MKKHTKVFLVVIALMGVGMSWHYFSGGSVSFSPKGAEGSAIDAVKATETSNSSSETKNPSDIPVGEVNLQGSEAQTLIHDTEFRKMILNEKFRGLLESPTYTEFAKSPLFFEFIQSPQLQTIEKSAEFGGLAKNPEFVELVQNPMFIDLMKNTTLTAIVRNAQFVELEKMTLASFE